MDTLTFIRRTAMAGALLSMVLFLQAAVGALSPTAAQGPLGTDEQASPPTLAVPDAAPEVAAVPSLSLPAGGGPSCPLQASFNGSAPGWVYHNGPWYVDANYLYTPGRPLWLTSASYSTEEFDNIDIQVAMKRSGAVAQSNANRVIVRGTPDPTNPEGVWYNGYSFQYTRDAAYSVWKAVAGTSFPVAPWAFSPAIIQGDAWNVLRVVAVGEHFDFYINGTRVWSGADTSLTKGRVGVGAYNGSQIDGQIFQVDYANICRVPTLYMPAVFRR